MTSGQASGSLDETSPGGSAILRHAAAPEGWHPRAGDGCIEQISRHVESHMGDLPMTTPAGTNALIDRFEERRVTDVVAPGRRDVARKRFGLR